MQEGVGAEETRVLRYKKEKADVEGRALAEQRKDEKDKPVMRALVRVGKPGGRARDCE